MPELPEVETTLQGLKPYLHGQPLTAVTIRAPKLRTALPPALAKQLTGRTVTGLARRNKYILAQLDDAHTLLLHLGMSGRLAVFPTGMSGLPPLHKHDHVTLLTPKAEVRFNDARRFGLFMRLPTAALAQHPLLAGLGPEPLTQAFSGATLHAALQGKSKAIKPTLMDNAVVCGVGNIYASESLFRSGIHPATPAHRLSLPQAHSLAGHIKQTLSDAIAAGGSSLRDFRHADGQLGYFQHTFNVYGRAGQPCRACGSLVQSAVMAQRNTFWCPTCQSARTVKLQK